MLIIKCWFIYNSRRSGSFILEKMRKPRIFYFPLPRGEGLRVKGIAEFPGGGSGMAVHFAQEYAFRRGEIKR